MNLFDVLQARPTGEQTHWLTSHGPRPCLLTPLLRRSPFQTIRMSLEGQKPVGRCVDSSVPIKQERTFFPLTTPGSSLLCAMGYKWMTWVLNGILRFLKKYDKLVRYGCFSVGQIQSCIQMCFFFYHILLINFKLTKYH